MNNDNNTYWISIRYANCSNEFQVKGLNNALMKVSELVKDSNIIIMEINMELYLNAKA